MTLRRIRELLAAELVFDGGKGQICLDLDLPSAISSDSMSDVLSFSEAGCLLLTGQTNPQSVRTAEMAEITAICFVQDKQPNPEAILLARKRGIVLLSTALSMYDACGRLFGSGLKGCEVQE